MSATEDKLTYALSHMAVGGQMLGAIAPDALPFAKELAAYLKGNHTNAAQIGLCSPATLKWIAKTKSSSEDWKALIDSLGISYLPDDPNGVAVILMEPGNTGGKEELSEPQGDRLAFYDVDGEKNGVFTDVGTKEQLQDHITSLYTELSVNQAKQVVDKYGTEYETIFSRVANNNAAFMRYCDEKRKTEHLNRVEEVLKDECNAQNAAPSKIETTRATLERTIDWYRTAIIRLCTIVSGHCAGSARCAVVSEEPDASLCCFVDDDREEPCPSAQGGAKDDDKRCPLNIIRDIYYANTLYGKPENRTSKKTKGMSAAERTARIEILTSYMVSDFLKQQGQNESDGPYVFTVFAYLYRNAATLKRLNNEGKGFEDGLSYCVKKAGKNQQMNLKTFERTYHGVTGEASCTVRFFEIYHLQQRSGNYRISAKNNEAIHGQFYS